MWRLKSTGFHLARLLGKRSHGCGIALAGEAGARLQHIGDDEAEDEREARHHLEIDQRLHGNATDFFHFRNMRNARHHRAEDDRCNHHADQLDEAVAERLDPVIPGEIWKQPADECTKHDGDQDLDVQNPIPGSSPHGFIHQSPLPSGALFFRRRPELMIASSNSSTASICGARSAPRDKRFAQRRSSGNRGKRCFTRPFRPGDGRSPYEEDHEASNRSFKTNGDQKLFLMKSLF